MKIGFDAKRLFSNYTGLGNYSRTFVRNLQELYPEHEYHLYTDRVRKTSETTYFLNPNRFIIHEGPKYFKSFWRSRFLVRDLIFDEIDIFHGLSNEIPFGIHKSGIKTLTTIHDLIFKAYPRQYKLFDRQIYHLKTKYAVQRADRIIAISQATKQSIIQYYNGVPSKIEVVYQSFGHDFITPKAPALNLVFEDYLPAKYFLFVGSIIERKGLLNIAKALSTLPKSERIPIVVVGNGTRYLKTVKRYLDKNGLTGQFHFLKNISNENLKYIYQRALALVFPSLIEGFGIPIIEAGLLKTAIITSNRSSLPEAGGPDVLQVDPESPNEIAEAMRHVVNGNYTDDNREKVFEYVTQKFDKVELTNTMMRIYEALLK